jgi:hypothetical protein
MSMSWQQPPERPPLPAESDEAYDAATQAKLDAIPAAEWNAMLEAEREARS